MEKTKKLLAHILCLFIPVAKWRKKIRARFGAKKPLPIDYAITNTMRFKVQPHSFWNIFNNESWEPATFCFYRKYVTPEKEVIDIGGWMGPTVLLAYSLNPKKIHVVEADPANYQILKSNCHQNYLTDKISLYNLCLTDTNNAITVFGFATPQAKGTSTKQIGGSHGVKVSTTDIVSFLKTRDLTATNIIKIDVEGAEQLFKQGFEYISTFKGLNILLSLHPFFWTNNAQTVDMLCNVFQLFQLFSESEQPLSSDELKEKILICQDGRAQNITVLLKTI